VSYSLHFPDSRSQIVHAEMIFGAIIIFIQVLQIFKCISIAETGDPLQEQYGSLKHASIVSILV